MRKPLILTALAVLLMGAVAVQTPMFERINFGPPGVSDALASIYYTETAGAPQLQVQLTTSDTVQYSLDGTSLYVGDSNIQFEGATADDFELTLQAADVGGDRTVTIPDTGGASSLITSSMTTNAPQVANSVWFLSNTLRLEGATADGFEVDITPADVAQDVVFTLPDAGSGAATVGDTTVTFAYGTVTAEHLDVLVFVADRAYVITDVVASWGTAETTAAMDVMVEKLVGVTACGSGTDTLSAAIDATGTANTTTSGTLHGTAANYAIAAGDTLCIDLTATPDEIANLVVTIALEVN